MSRPGLSLSSFLLSASALALAAAPLQAQEPSAKPAAEATAEAPSEAQPAQQKTRYERRICKSSAPTGTRIAKKTCLTQAQWEDAQRRSQDATDTVQKNQLMINRKIEGGQ